jgi:hypothetical protein
MRLPLHLYYLFIYSWIDTKIWMLPLVSYVTEGDDKSMSVVAVFVILSSALSAEFVDFVG